MTESPFLPRTNIQWAWDSTSLSYLKTCPRLYYYHMIEGWNPPDESVHLRFGIEYHQALQEYDICRHTDQCDHDEAVFQVVRELLIRTGDWRPDHKYKNRNNLVRTVIWYLEKFKDDPAKTFVMANGKPAVEVSFRFELDWGPKQGFLPPLMVVQGVEIDYDLRPGAITYVEDVSEVELKPQTQPYLLCGHLDRVVEYMDNLFVMDRKTTTSTLGDYYFNQFQPNNQMTLYTIAGQIVMNCPIKGVMIDAAVVKMEFSEFGRDMTYRTPDQTKEWLDDLRYWLDLAESYAVANHWPMNDTACDKFGGCKFREICSKSPQVREAFLKSNFVKGERWNPLRPR